MSIHLATILGDIAVIVNGAQLLRIELGYASSDLAPITVLPQPLEHGLPILRVVEDADREERLVVHMDIDDTFKGRRIDAKVAKRRILCGRWLAELAVDWHCVRTRN